MIIALKCLIGSAIIEPYAQVSLVALDELRSVQLSPICPTTPNLRDPEAVESSSAFVLGGRGW